MQIQIQNQQPQGWVGGGYKGKDNTSTEDFDENTDHLYKTNTSTMDKSTEDFDENKNV